MKTIKGERINWIYFYEFESKPNGTCTVLCEHSQQLVDLSSLRCGSKRMNDNSCCLFSEPKASHNRLLGIHISRLLYCCCYCQQLVFFLSWCHTMCWLLIVTTFQQQLNKGFVKMCCCLLTCADIHPTTKLLHWCLSTLPSVCHLCLSINLILYSWWSHIRQNPIYQYILTVCLQAVSGPTPPHEQTLTVNTCLFSCFR